MFNSLFGFFFFFFFEKHIPSQVMRDFSVQNLETTPRIFLSNFFCDIYLSRIVNYSDSVFTLHLTWGAFSLVCVPSVFFFFLSSFFSAVFSLIDTNGCRIARKGDGIIIFLVFNFHLLTNIYLFHRNFYHFFLLDIFIITRMIADETCST